jgi:hypothetical protein
VANFSRSNADTANSLIMLMRRFLWLELNGRAFNNSPSYATGVLDDIVEQWQLWLSCRCGRLGVVGEFGFGHSKGVCRGGRCVNRWV